MTILFQVPRDRGEGWISGQVPGYRGVKFRINSQRGKLNHHNLKASTTRYIENVFANVRQKMNRPEDDQIVLDQEVNVLICFFMSTTMKAAIHLGENYNDNLFTYKNTNFEAFKTLFDITQKLILNQKHEIRHISTTECHLTSWMRSTLLHDNVIKLSKAKVHVYCTDIQMPWQSGKNHFNISRIPLNLSSSRTHYSGSSPRDWREWFGYLQEHQLRRAQTLFDITQKLILDQDFEILNVSTIERKFSAWTRLPCCMTKKSIGRKQRYTSTPIQFFVWERCTSIQKLMQIGKISCKTSNSPTHTKIYLDRWKPIEFEWNKYLPTTHNIADSPTDSRKSGSESSSCLCSTTLVGESKEILENVFSNSEMVTSRSRSRRKMVWNAQLQTWMKVERYCRCHGRQFQRQWTSSNPSYQCIGPVILEKNKGESCTIHFSGDPSNAELLFRTINSANQLSTYGAIADWCSRFLVNHFQTWRIQLRKWLSSYVENWSLKRWICWYKHPRQSCLRFVNQLGSLGQSLLDNTSNHSRCGRYLVMTRIRNLLVDSWTHQDRFVKSGS